jgi:PAS domain S-box-containing protein
VAAVRQKHLVLILAREFASNLATPTLITDERGYVVYFNEAAEEVFGRSFSEVGEMALDEWTSQFSPRYDRHRRAASARAAADRHRAVRTARGPRADAVHERRRRRS